METFEYNNIIDFYAKQFHIYVSSEERVGLIDFYKEIGEMEIDMDFNKFCEHHMIEIYLDTKYPTLNLYNTIFSYPKMN